MARLLTSVHGKTVLLTGYQSGDLSKDTVWEMIEDRGGTSYKPNHVPLDLDIFVRGRSGQWLYGKYGNKEQEVADLVRSGGDIVVVDSDEFIQLLETGQPAYVSDVIAGIPVSALQSAPTQNSYAQLAAAVDAADEQITTTRRKEQAFLRQQLFGDERCSVCSICGKNLPVELMIAAHVKPRRNCTDEERNDFAHVVFSICGLGCDLLYDRGFITVNERGVVVATEETDAPKDLASVLTHLSGRECTAFSTDSASYFAWHQHHVYKQ